MKPTPILSLTGQNETYKRDYLENLLAKYSREDVTVYFADEVEPQVIFLQCSQDSLFGNENVVVVKNIDALSKTKKDFDEKLSDYLDHPNPNCLLILLSGKLNSGILKKIKETGEVVEFKKAYKSDLIRYISDKLSGNNIRFDLQLPDFIVSLANEDSEEIDMMLRLLIQLSGETKTLTLEDAQKLLSRSTNMNIFDFIGGLFRKDAVKALHALSDLRLLGETPTRISYMLLRTAKLLWGYFALSDKSMALDELQIKPYELKMLSEYARIIDLKFVSAVIELIKRVEIKTKSMSEEFAFLEIENFILSKAVK
jgi:DNA polymerase III delta subunit